LTGVASVVRGSSFTALDTANNRGEASSPSTTTRYYLSLDAIKSSSDVRLSGSRSVSSLAAGASSSGSATVSVSSSQAAGTYYLIACSDDSGTVAEIDESNNCRTAAATISVTP
jgi:subtilase family serine protease